MQSKTYSELYALVTALAGVGSFTTEEQASILAFVNRRAMEAYNSSRSWPRYLVVGEERAISVGQYIPYSEGSLDDIAEFVRIHRTQPFVNLGAHEYDFYVDSVGAHILSAIPTDSTSAFVTYKKPFESFAEASVNFPMEFFQFCAHAAYADFLRMDGQIEKAFAEERSAQIYLALELEKVDQVMNNTTVATRFTTYVSRQSR
jgi:hypothetical protein